MKDYSDKIIELANVKSPYECPSEGDWIRLENDLDLKFPSDFKKVVSALGSGWFGVGIYLRNPASTHQGCLLSRSELIKYSDLMSESALRANISMYPKSRGLVSVARIDRQSFLLQPDPGGKQLCEIVWWDSDLDSAIALPMSFSQFIHDSYFDLIKGPQSQDFHESFWGDGDFPFFTSWKRK